MGQKMMTHISIILPLPSKKSNKSKDYWRNNNMGYRLHVAKEHKVHYATGDAFNYKVEEFHHLLSACDATYTGESWDSDFEVTKDDWQKVIDKLKNLDAQEEKTEIQECIKELEYSTEEVIESMEYFLKESDPDNDYLFLSYF